jgi:septum site-determining protein MinC
MNDSVTPEAYDHDEARAAGSPAPKARGADSSPLVFKGASYTLTSIRLNTTDLGAIAIELSAKVTQAPEFFRDAPMVIDLEGVEMRPLDMTGLLKTLRTHGLLPVGVRGGSQRQQAAGRAAGLPLLRGTHYHAPAKGEPASRGENLEADRTPRHTEPRAPEPPPDPVRGTEPESAPAGRAEAQPQAQTRVVTQPVRSGQQVYAAGGDLILLGAVNAGAEILADGNIHVYAPLRGRALAGVKGNPKARIFAHSMEAELVSIAGIYQMFDEDASTGWKGKPAQIYLEGDALKIEPIV